MEKLDGLSMDIEQVELDKLASLFPQCFVEGKLVLDKLLALLGEYDIKDFERYEFTWKGKSECLPLAQKRSTGTLRPCPEESVDFENTQNLYIEGDNLEVLKLLQTPYYRQVKMIYIDPPYNTGNDFVYEDDFTDTLAKYKEVTSQATKSNPESMGRFHTKWLNMMYPRLRLAANLLRDDGVIFISINDEEQANLKKICDEVFGEENFVAQIIWKARVKPINIGDAKHRPQKEIEYVLVYQKSSASKFLPLYTGGERSYPHTIDGRRYRLTTILKSNRGTNYRSTMSFELEGFTPPEGQRWQGGEDLIKQKWNDGYIEFRDGTPFHRYYEDEEGAEHDPFYCFMETEWSSTSEVGKNELNTILGNNHGFDTVKPVRLLKTLMQATLEPSSNDIVLDFFSGSGTTAHALMSLNKEDGGNRRFILVQLPELCPEDSEPYKAGFKNLCELGKERIRRAGKDFDSGQLSLLEAGSSLDTGFKVFKLDSSNLKTWDSSPIADDDLLSYAKRFNDMIDRVKADRTDLDMVYEIMLKMGVPLTEPVAQVSISGKTAYSVGQDCLLLICLTGGLTVEIIEEMAEYAPAKLIVAENSLADDSAMSNAHYMLRDRGIELKLV